MSARPVEPAAVLDLVDGERVIGTWPVPGLDRPDLGVVDTLARLQLAARRRGLSIRIRNAGVDLERLLDLVGLRDVVEVIAATEPTAASPE